MGWAKVGLQLWIHKTQSLFLYYYLLIIVLFSIWTTVNLLLTNPVFSPSLWLNYFYGVFLYQIFLFYIVKSIYNFVCNLCFLCPVYEILFCLPHYFSLNYSPIFSSKIVLKFCLSCLCLIRLELTIFSMREKSNFNFSNYFSNIYWFIFSPALCNASLDEDFSYTCWC